MTELAINTTERSRQLSKKALARILLSAGIGVSWAVMAMDYQPYSSSSQQEPQRGRAVNVSEAVNRPAPLEATSANRETDPRQVKVVAAKAGKE